MSNVLIGIIGVICFVGLALAGASYIGALVTDGTTQRNAAQVITSGQQMAAAVKIYNLRKRTLLPNTIAASMTLVSAGILKIKPANPFSLYNYPAVIGPDAGFSPIDMGRPTWVIMSLGQTELSLDACIEIEIQNKHSERADPETMAIPINFLSHATAEGPGCHREAGAFGTNASVAGDYIAFFPI